MDAPTPRDHRGIDAATWAWLGLLVLALLVYSVEIGGQYNPSNGDELVYAHIARLTAASNHWLPLVSELDQMRNTKPPLLFWQAIVAGDWGRHWSLTALRLPSLVYTLLVAGLLIWAVHGLCHDLRTACLAACVYLAFFCTFRYGRTYLTSAPESFWLNIPMFWLVYRNRHRRTPVLKTSSTPSQAVTIGWTAHAVFGLALGLGLDYKSFALILPAAAALWFAELLGPAPVSWREALRITLKAGLSATLALGIFALWFALDPDPGAVWQEFVVGENARKLSSAAGYWHSALFAGGASMWAQLLAYVQNAGLLAFVVLGLAWVGVRGWAQRLRAMQSTPGLPVLWIWLAVWLIVFTLPSQRSARYVIPAMPALAALTALYWHRIGRGWFLLTLTLAALSMAAMGRVAWVAHELNIATDPAWVAAIFVVFVGLLLAFAGWARPAWTRACTLATCLLTLGCFTLTVWPLNNQAGHYARQTVARLSGARIAVPSGFNGQFERFEFLLPGNRFIAYDGEARAPSGLDAKRLERLLSDFDAVIWLASSAFETAPACRPACTVLDSRWEVQGRHGRGEITIANLWYPQQWLFRREWLLANGTGAVRAPS